MEGDNLSSLFPNAHLKFGAFELDSHHIFALATTLAVLPTVWLRDLSILSYLSGEHCLFSNANSKTFDELNSRLDQREKNSE